MNEKPRCSTCPYFEQHYCNYLKDRMANVEIVLIERVGCASHPQSNRAQTLAEVVRSVRHLIREEGYTCGEAEHILVHLKEMR
jgi:hypothetical protein